MRKTTVTLLFSLGCPLFSCSESTADDEEQAPPDTSLEQTDVAGPNDAEAGATEPGMASNPTPDQDTIGVGEETAEPDSAESPPGPSSPTTQPAMPSDTPAPDPSNSPAENPASEEDEVNAPVVDFEPFPGESEQHGDVFNLVNPAAVAELDEYLLGTDPVHVALREGMMNTVNQFISLFEEQYDFLFFFHDHTIETPVAGKFQAVTRPAMRGNGAEIQIELAGYRTDGRLKGIAAFRLTPGIYPPLAHEAGHYWLAHLDPSFGFGAPDYPLHWGYSSVNGHLGGYDPATLECATPSGASPPDCTPEESGRIRYVAETFGPNTNGFKATPFSPLELYLMGLGPIEDVRDAFQVMVNPTWVEDDADAGLTVFEADGLNEVTMAEIVARHGDVELLPPEQRQFSAAFIIVSEQRAAEEAIQEVTLWATEFGGRGAGIFPSFEDYTSGLATMDTTLGPRRRIGDTPPEPRERFVCDPLEQDCSGGLACDVTPPICVLRGDTAEGQPCDSIFACAAGLECFSGESAPNDFVCSPYCVPDDPSSSEACDALCPGNYFTYSYEDVTIAGQCVPE